MQAKHVGCEVKAAKDDRREFGPHIFIRNGDSPLFAYCPEQFQVVQSHGDQVYGGLSQFEVLGTTDNSPVAAGSFKHLMGVQFHPEVEDTKFGDQIFENFCFGICGAKDRFPAEDLAERKIQQITNKIAGKKVLLALSGGSDSSTVAYLLKHAVCGEQGRIRAVYIKGIGYRPA